jgi:hypothetical protein
MVVTSCNTLRETGDIDIVTNSNDTIKAAAIRSNLDYFSGYSDTRRAKHHPTLNYGVITDQKSLKKMSIGLDSIDYITIKSPVYKDTSIYILVKSTAVLSKETIKRSNIILSTLIPTYGIIHGIVSLTKKKDTLKNENPVHTFYQFWKWRFLYTKGDLSIAERKWEVSDDDDNYYDETEIAIFSGSRLKVVIDGSDNSNKKDWSTALLSFINARYNLEMTHDEFLNYINQKEIPENQTKVFDFILAQEAVLSNAKNTFLPDDKDL